MKKIGAVLMAIILLIGLAGCSGHADSDRSGQNAAAESDSASLSVSEDTADVSEPDASSSNAPETAPESSSAAPEAKDPPEDDKTLVVVFSATGTTKGVAEKIAAITGADLYEIKAAQEYTSDDLNWHDSGSRTTEEQNDKSIRPEIGSESISLEGYTVIFIGYPIWWGEEPRIMDTFVESYHFDGITMIPFCTSSSSGIGRSGQNLEENAGSGNWLDGQRFSGNVSEEDLKTWIEELQ